MKDKLININVEDYINFPWTTNHCTIWGRRITSYNRDTQTFGGDFFRSLEAVSDRPGDVLRLGIKPQYKQSHNRKDFFVVDADYNLERVTRGHAAGIASSATKEV